MTSALETKAATSGTSLPAPWLIEAFGGSPTTSKFRVNVSTAMRCPPVKHVVDLISPTLATLPIRLLKANPTG
ncbi:hypothetical protein IPV08_22990 [Methylobacterium sp. SD274]|uniref:hypothetical protein n=1 Tax=Methylobacterium sp. SD274 TaxID=2782009 RepID=UPI001A95BEDB|nr:hypothetical protein [Methylobacterium sp. SD274]MBO1022829.1 hypothetical protein [Methylobacterium sp. SD274]